MAEHEPREAGRGLGVGLLNRDALKEDHLPVRKGDYSVSNRERWPVKLEAGGLYSALLSKS